jgi:uncharacterized protein YhbP (UPF0306 family)
MAEEQNSRIMASARNLIRQSQSITLATSENNIPWGATVYFAAAGDGLYFFSSPDSRHIREGLASGCAAGAIYMEDASWQNFTGLQLSGNIMAVSGKKEAGAAILAYTKKSPFVKTFFKNIPTLGLNDFLRRFNAMLYCFTPDVIFFMDNSEAFGFRETLSREQLFS